MPRLKVVKLPNPDDVAKKLAKRDREVAKEFAKKREALILKITPLLLEWKDDEPTKHIPNTGNFSCEEEQTWIAKQLTALGWKVLDEGAGITVHRPVQKKASKAQATPQRRQQGGTRRAARDPAPSTAAAAPA